MTWMPGNFLRRHPVASGCSSKAASSVLSPMRCRISRVIAPVPAPSSTTICADFKSFGGTIALASAGELGATAPTVSGRRKNAEIKCQYSDGDELSGRAGVFIDGLDSWEAVLTAGWVAVDGSLIGGGAANSSMRMFCAGGQTCGAKHSAGNPCGTTVGRTWCAWQAAEFELSLNGQVRGDDVFPAILRFAQHDEPF